MHKNYKFIIYLLTIIQSSLIYSCFPFKPKIFTEQNENNNQRKSIFHFFFKKNIHKKIIAEEEAKIRSYSKLLAQTKETENLKNIKAIIDDSANQIIAHQIMLNYNSQKKSNTLCSYFIKESKEIAELKRAEKTISQYLSKLINATTQVEEEALIEIIRNAHEKLKFTPTKNLRAISFSHLDNQCIEIDKDIDAESDKVTITQKMLTLINKNQTYVSTILQKENATPIEYHEIQKILKNDIKHHFSLLDEKKLLEQKLAQLRAVNDIIRKQHGCIPLCFYCYT